MKRKLILSGAVALVVLLGVALLCLRPEEERPAVPVPVPPEPVPATETRGEPPAVAAKEPETVSEAVITITDDAGAPDFRARVVLVSKLSPRLNRADREKLCDYLRNGENTPQTDHIKNDILNRLREQEPPPPELTQVMLDIFNDRNQSNTMRSYMIQHMESWYSDENMREEAVKEAFYRALEERGNELPGVALLALASLSEQFPETFERTAIAEKAAEIAADAQSSELARITALDVSSRLGNASALEAARGIIRGGSGNTMLNSVAFGVIGREGDASDLPLLEEALESGRAGQRAARLAVKKLERK